eukprot:CAMPEP_0206204800 /NCGR_PEP_ID=MMETSP0166-20121206/13781_1 /ASSEMBLY_ACC=CAM_ASM_000260 /TAXON_ID=95228 /ORGANISM="Vannella robusta, Strain DIVA3 518/3/11/1/6" /LENGTH=874 /DNA_ID=CAMNT_0053624579 /DNA_START=1105 /DNA_END=3729 /DNA_ORIENTATION=+
MSENNLVGTIPPSMGELESLLLLDLSENRLSGTLPAELFIVESLRVIALNDNNGLGGVIPSSIADLKSLQRLDLSWCNLTGEIPQTIGDCSALQILSLQYNRLVGSIPNLSGLANLEQLNLHSNFLSGEFPSAISDLPMLNFVDLSENVIFGTLPDTLGRLSLQQLSLSYNQLDGSIPDSLYHLDTLEVLLLSGNLLSGTISPDITNMTKLTKLDLSLNLFYGEVPPLNNLLKLKYLDLSTCGLSGTLPSFSHLPQIQFIDISANEFSGTLPENPPTFKFLRDFDVSSNSLSGTVPEWVSEVTFSMYLVDNNFLCPYPSDIPSNVQLNQECVSGAWYQGIFFILICSLELFCFVITSVVVSLSTVFGLRPALLKTLTEESGKELEVDKLHRWSRYLGKTKTAVFISSAFELTVITLMTIIGISIRFGSNDLYSQSLYEFVFILSALFFVKCGVIIGTVKKSLQRTTLMLISLQILQLGFIPIAYGLQGLNSQAPRLCAVIILLILIDTITNIFAALSVFLVQDQFIPIRHLKLDDKLKDAEGVFGEVCHGKYFGMDIAVKRAKPETKQERNLVYKAFLREARILGDLGNHPNIVKLIGISPMLKDEFYIVMEYCDNRDALSFSKKVKREEDLRTWIRVVLKLCIGVCDAMRYLHSQGYTHRDITACNILVKGERAMLADLGLARKDDEIIDPAIDCMPQNHLLYAPPELVENPENYTTGCDVYCFAIALWEMLMLRRWSHENVMDRVAALNELDQFPLYFKNIVSQCWHEEDEFRPTFDELLADFVKLHQQEWSMYREVFVDNMGHSIHQRGQAAVRDVIHNTNNCRLTAYSAADIAENSSYHVEGPQYAQQDDNRVEDTYRTAESSIQSLLIN